MRRRLAATLIAAVAVSAAVTIAAGYLPVSERRPAPTVTQLAGAVGCVPTRVDPPGHATEAGRCYVDGVTVLIVVFRTDQERDLWVQLHGGREVVVGDRWAVQVTDPSVSQMWERLGDYRE